MYHELRKRGTSAADLKFLQRLRHTHFRNFKSKSGTRIINLLVPLCFRSSCQRVPRCITNFGSGALAGTGIGTKGLCCRPNHGENPCQTLGISTVAATMTVWPRAAHPV